MSTKDSVSLFFSPKASGLRRSLKPEFANAADFLLRQAIRRVSTQVEVSAPRLPFMPKPEDVPVPFFTVAEDGLGLGLKTLREATEQIAPPLTQDEEIYALSMLDLLNEVSGLDLKSLYLDPFGTARDLVAGGLAAAASDLTGSDLLSVELEGREREIAEEYASEILGELRDRYIARLV